MKSPYGLFVMVLQDRWVSLHVCATWRQCSLQRCCQHPSGGAGGRDSHAKGIWALWSNCPPGDQNKHVAV